MGIMGSAKQFFSKNYETKDHHEVEVLRTKYYKCTPKKAFSELELYFNKLESVRVESISEDRGEIGFVFEKGRKRSFIVLTVVGVRPFETAVDFHAYTDTAFPTDFGYSKKLIELFYKEVDKRLPKK